MLVDIHHIGDQRHWNAQETGQLLYLWRLFHHGNGCQTEVLVKNQYQHDGRQSGVFSNGTEVALEGLFHLHALVETATAVETYHVAQQLHGTCQSFGVAAVVLPDTLDARCLKIGYLAHSGKKLLGCNVQLNTQFHHGATVHRLHPYRFVKVQLHQ